MFPADVEKECLWSSLEDLVWASVRCGVWLTKTILAHEYLGRRGEVLWYVGFSVGAVCCSYWGKFSYDLLKATGSSGTLVAGNNSAGMTRGSP